MKKLIFVSSLFFTATLLCAASKDEIYIPDLTTVIEDSSEVLIPEINLELSAEIEVPEGTFSGNVLLPEPEKKEEVKEEVSEIVIPRPLVLEGALGAGWPGLFKGNLSLHSGDENNPDYLNAAYSTMKHYAGENQYLGHYDSNLMVSGEKVFSDEKNICQIKGRFIDLENGLQNQCEESSFYNRTSFSGEVNYSRKLPKGFIFNTAFSGDYFIRNSDRINDKQFVKLFPEIQFLWTYKNFQASILGNYEYLNGLNSETHRGVTALELTWQNKNVMLLGNIGAVFGNRIGSQPVQAPFKLKTDVHFPVKKSEMVLSLEGGMSSESTNVISLEQNYSYAAFTALPSEVSDWYGILNFYLPVKSAISINLNTEYRKTAFGNGFVQPVYEDLSIKNGLYGFDAFDRQLIKVSGWVSYNYKSISLSGGWKSYFDFVPETEGPASIFVNASYDGNRFGALGDFSFPILAVDYAPLINLEGSVKINSDLRIALCIDDTVKLLNGKNRICAGKYVSRSGSASLLVKYNY